MGVLDRVLGGVLPLLFAAESLAAIPITGRVLDAEDRPLAGAAIDLRRVEPAEVELAAELEQRVLPPLESTRSAADGTYRIDAPAPGLYRVRIALDGHLPLEIAELLAVEDLELAPVRPPRDAGGEIQVVGPDGKGIEGARVRIESTTPRRPGGAISAGRVPVQRGRTDAEGRLRFAAVARPSWSAAVAAPGFVPQRIEWVQGTRQRIVLERGVVRSVEVRRQGRPLPDAIVALADGMFPLARTGSDGRTAVVTPRGNGIEIGASGPESWLGRTTLRPAKAGEEPTQVVLDLREPVRLAGRVLDRATGTPVPGAIAALQRSLLPSWSVAGPRGDFVLVAPERRHLTIIAAAPGYLKASANASASEADSAAIALERAAGVEGHVVDAGGVPVADARVLANPRAYFTGMAPPRIEDAQETRSDGRGAFRFRSLPAGLAFDLLATKAGFGPGEERIDEVAPGERRRGLLLELPPAGRLVGRVLSAAEQPVAGAQLVLVPNREQDFLRRISFRSAERERTAKALSGADGGFAFGDLGGGRFDLLVAASGFAPTTIPRVEIPAGGGAVDLGEILLDPGAEVEGRVVDAAGKAVAEAEIVLHAQDSGRLEAAFADAGNLAPAATTGPDGRFRVVDRRPGERIDLEARKKGFAQERLPEIVVPPPEPVRIVLQPLGSIRGRVLDGDLGVEGARIDARMAGGSMRGGEDTVSDAEGEFEITDMTAGEVTLSAAGPEGGRGEVRGLKLAPGGAIEGVEIVLEHGSTVAGRVTLAGGEPAVGARVTAGPQATVASSAGGNAYATTDGDGRFRLDDLRPGRQTIFAAMEPYRSATKEVEVGKGESWLELVLEPGLAARGIVTDEEERPVGDAMVYLQAAASRGFRPSGISRTDGSFEVQGLEPGTYRLSAQKEGFARGEAPAPVVLVDADVEGLRVRLERGGSIHGRISGVAFDELADVAIAAQSERTRRTTEPDYEGVYSIAGLEDGDWSVTATVHSTGKRASGHATLAPGRRDAEVDLELGKGLVLSGTLWRDGEPAPGAWFLLQGVDNRATATTQADYTGRFRLEGLEEGTYRLRARGTDDESQAELELRLDGDREIRVDLSSARIEGVVTAARDGTPIEAAQVRAVPVASSQLTGFGGGGFATTDRAGRYQVRGLAPAEYRIVVTAEGFAAASRQIVLAAIDQQQGEDFSLEENEGVSLLPRRADGRSVSNVIVAALDASGGVVAAQWAAVGEDGIARLSSVPRGHWTLLVTAPESAPAQVEIDSPASGVQVVLPAAGTLRVVVNDLAGTDALALVRLTGPDGRVFLAPSGASPVSEFRAPGGVALLTGIPAGSWTVEATTGDGRRWTGGVDVAPDAETTLRLD